MLSLAKARDTAETARAAIRQGAAIPRGTARPSDPYWWRAYRRMHIPETRPRETTGARRGRAGSECRDLAALGANRIGARQSSTMSSSAPARRGAIGRKRHRHASLVCSRLSSAATISAAHGRDKDGESGRAASAYLGRSEPRGRWRARDARVHDRYSYDNEKRAALKIWVCLLAAYIPS